MYLEKSLEEKYLLGAIPASGHTLYELGRNVLINNNNLDQARHYFQQSLNIANKYKDFRYILCNNAELGKILFTKGKIEESYLYFQTVWDITRRLGISKKYIISSFFGSKLFRKINHNFNF